MFPDSDRVIELIRQHGLFGLGGSDGCQCMHLQLHGYYVDVSCRKSEHTVRVYSHCIGVPISDGFRLAAEVLHQLGDYAGGYSVRFCDFQHDSKNGRWEQKVWKQDHSCCYCWAIGRAADAYLCEECAAMPDLASQYDAAGWPMFDPRRQRQDAEAAASVH